MAANLIMQLPAQNPPGFASDWGSLSEPSYWSSSVGSSANKGAASGARGGLAIRLWSDPIHGPEILDSERPDLRQGPQTDPICYSLQLVAAGGLLQMTALTQILQDFKNFKSVNKNFVLLWFESTTVKHKCMLILHQLCLLYEINLLDTNYWGVGSSRFWYKGFIDGLCGAMVRSWSRVS